MSIEASQLHRPVCPYCGYEIRNLDSIKTAMTDNFGIVECPGCREDYICIEHRFFTCMKERFSG